MCEEGIALETVWTPRARYNCMGGRRSNIYVSHWNRQRRGLLVAFNMRDGKLNKTSRVSIHPAILLEEYEAYA